MRREISPNYPTFLSRLAFKNFGTMFSLRTIWSKDLQHFFALAEKGKKILNDSKILKGIYIDLARRVVGAGAP